MEVLEEKKHSLRYMRYTADNKSFFGTMIYNHPRRGGVLRGEPIRRNAKG